MSNNRACLIPAILALLAAQACNRKVDECNQLAAITNEGVQGIAEIGAAAADDPEKAVENQRAMAKLAEGIQGRIAALRLETEALVPKAEAYETMMKELGEVGSEHAERLETLDAKLAELPTVKKTFEASRDALGDACADGPPEDCGKLAKLTGDMPAEIPGDQVPEVFAKYVEDLEALELSDEELAAIVAEHREAVAAYGAHMGEIAAKQRAVAEVQERLDAVIAREDAVVADLNGFCVGESEPSATP